MQLNPFPQGTTTIHLDPFAAPLLMLSCCALKAAAPEPALHGLVPAFAEEMGSHANGTTTFRRFGALEVGTDAELTYRNAQVPARNARILALFRGPGGNPTAEVEVDSTERGRPHSVGWVNIADLQPL